MINPREQAHPPRLRFNFDKAKQSGASDEDILEFLQSRDTNIDWGELETRSQGYQNPLAYKISTLAQNDWEFLPPKPQEATEPSPSLESTQPHTTQEDFTPTLDKLENESALREIYRDLAPSFMLTKEMEQDNATLQKAIDEAKEQGRAFSDLHPSLKQALRKRAHQEKSVFTNPLATPHDLALESYEKDLRDLHIAKKTPQELDQSDKDYIKSRASAWDKIFASDDEIYRDFIENKRAEKIVPKEMKTALEVLDNFHQYKSIASLLTGSDEKAKTDYLNSAHTIATNLGFEGIGVNDKGELFLNHKGEFYRINSGFFESLPTILAANAGSITGGIAGAFAGAARGAKLGRAGGGYGATAGAVVGGAVGAFGGGALDTILGNAYLHRETNAQEILAHATQEGVLNIVGDMAILGAIKAYDKLKGAGIAQSLGKIIDYTPVLGFVKRSQDGNQAMAQNLLSQTYTKEQEKSLQEASENFGLALEIGDHTKRIDTTNLPPKFKDAVDKVQDIFTLKNQQQFQSRLLQAIRADESGNLLGFITEAASKSPKAHNTLTRILHQTTQKLKRNLESIAPKSSLKAIFDELEKGTKDSYDEAITQILGTIYDDTYKVNLNTLKEQSGSPSFEAFKQSLADSGVAPESSANFLNFIEKNIYNPKGVSFTQLNNALKNLNAYYKNERDPNFKTHIKQAYDSFVRSDIKAGIESIFAQNKVAYNDAKTLFDTALLDYATMKDSLKLADRLKIRDRKNTNEKALQSLLDFAKGQGDKEANLDAITKALPQGARAHIEIAMLEELFRKSMLEVRDIQVFNSTKFLDNIKELKGTFTSKAAHDYINAAEKFHALFKNDPLILQAIKPATTDKIGSSIATTLEGAVKFQVIKGIFANMIRLLPHIPLLPSVNQKVQGAALRHHLSKALESSYNIGDLKLELTRLEKRGNFTNATKEHIRTFKGELDNARQEVLDIAKTPHTLESTAPSTAPKVDSSVESTPAQPSSRADEIGAAIHKEAPQETQKVDSSPKTSEIKQELLQRLKPILNKPLTNAQGVQAYINHASIDKMLSDKAIAKSVSNGFSKQEHLEAVGDIERLFGISQEAATHSHKGDNPSVIIHRLNAPFKNANALITTKESLDKDKNRIYSVELELTPRFSTPVRPTDTEASKGSLDSLNGQGGQDLPTIAKAKDEREMTKSIDSSDFTKGETLPLNSSADSTTQSLMQQAKQEALAKQEQLAEQAKAKELAEQQTAQAIKDHNDQIQAQKDARVGKGEMDRDIHIGEPIEVRKTSTPSTSIATDDDNIYQLDFVIVKAHAVKPNFSSDGLQPRTQKEHKTIESIAQNFKPEMVLGRGGYKDLPIIAKDGQVITGNHRVQGFKDFSPNSRATYQSAIKDRFGIELADDELLLRMPTKDLSTKELLSIAYNSNKEDIKNLGDHIYSVLGRYAPNFDKLPRQLESTSVQELKSKIAKILDPSPYPNENDTNLALLAHTIKADKNANITEMLNAFSKLDKEDADKTLQTFTDTAGLWHILSNNAVEYGLKQLDLRPYLLGAMYKAATSLHTTRAANFKELNEQIKHIIDTTDSSGTNMMLEMMPNTYDNLIADLLGASLARFMRLENPSRSLYESLRNTHKDLEAQLAPRIDFFSETGFTQGKNISQADIFDFIEYMIKQGEAGSEVAQAVELLPKLREKYTAFKGEDSALGRHSADLDDPRAVITDKVTPTLESPKSHESPTAKQATAVQGEAAAGFRTPRILEGESTPTDTPKVDSSLSQEIKDIIDSSPEKGRDMQIIGEANFTPQVVEYAHKNNKKVAIDKLDKAEAEQLGFKHPSDVRVTIDYQAINHTLNRHGADSPLVQQSGQKALDYTDIAKYRSIVKGADESLNSVDNSGNPVLVSYKQVNGHFVVVEQIKKKNNEISFKTMFKESGDYKNSQSYKDTRAKAQTLSIGYEPSANSLAKADEIIPQTQPQMPTDLKDPIKTIEYFKKDLLGLKRFFDQDMGGRLKPTPQEYLQAIVGKTIQAQEKLLARAKDELETTLDSTIKHYDRHNGTQDFKAFADKDIKTIMDYIIKFDVEKSHKNARDFFTLMQESEKNIDINPLSWGAIKNYRQDVLEIFQAKLADHEAQTQKQILAQKLKDKLKDPNSQEYKLIQDITEPSTAQKADSSEPTQKGLFDEVDSSVEATKQSSREQVKQQLQSIKNKDLPHKSDIIPHTLSKKQQEKLAQIDKQIAQSQKYLKEAQEKLADFESGKAIADYKERWARNLKEAEADYKEALKNANPSRLTEIKTLFDNQISELQWKLTDEGVQQFIRQNHPAKHIEYLKQELETLHATRQSTLESTPKAPKLPKITESYIKQTLENPTAVYETLDPQGKAALKEAFMEKFKAARENSKKWQDLRTILRNFEAYDDSLALQQLKSQEALESTHKAKEPTQKGLFDEADSSTTPQAQPSSRADEIGAAIHKEAPTQTPKDTPTPQETPKVDSTAWQKEFIEKIKNDKSREVSRYYPQGEALIVERKINNADVELISITKEADGSYFATFLGRFISQEQANTYKSFLENGFKGKEKELLKFLEKEPVNIGDTGIAFIPTLNKFFGVRSWEDNFTEFFIHKHFGDTHTPYTSLGDLAPKAKDNLRIYIDRLFKDNGYPFGFLINNKKTIQRLTKDKELETITGKGAVETLLIAKMGHIENAFYKEGLGAIDLVWGDEKIGLQKIVEKHLDDFASFGSGEAGIIKGISEIVENGKLITENGVNTLWYKKGDEYYLVGISKGFNNKGENNWIITSYKKTKGRIPDEIKGDTANLTAYSDEFNPLLTSKDEPLNSSDIIPQAAQEKPKWSKADQKAWKAATLAETRYNKDDALTPAYSHQVKHNTNTSSETRASGDESIIPQPTTLKADSNALLKSAMKKFSYDEKKAKDLLEWHKDSSPLTKDENGLPKVFYHGTSSNKVFEVFNKDKIHSGYGFWFGDDIADRAVKENTTGKAPIIKAFLQMKKPFIFSNQGITAKNIDEYAYITGISKKRITELYEAKEAFNTLEKMIQRDTQADYVWAGAVDYFEIEKGGKELNIFDYRQLDLSDQTIAFLDRMRTKGITARGQDISPTRQYESAQEARETLERLKEKGYDSMVYANSEFVVFESNQIKHIENRGGWRDSNGNFTGENPKDTKGQNLFSAKADEATHKYFNSSSPNIFHSNPHLGAGLLGGSVAGIEQDENGQWRFSPEKFALGLLGGVAGSKAVAKGLEWRAKKVAKSYPNIAKDNPQLMQEIAKRDLHTYTTASTHNALTRFLHNNKLFDINPQLFAGEKALANEAYAPHKARLERAKELEAKGAKEIEIWEQTGWYKDKDQRWKFEISQRGGKLKGDLESYLRDNKGQNSVQLQIILKDDELFSAYPQLKNMEIIFDDLGSMTGGSYNHKFKRIRINKNYYPSEQKSALYHELQHAIQDIEGFGFGEKLGKESSENYHFRHGEVEARNVQKRMRDYGEYAKEDAEKILKRLQDKEGYEERKRELQTFLNEKLWDKPPHPHKTMSIDVSKTIAEATINREALSKELEKGFLDSSGRIDFSKINAQPLPEATFKNVKQFTESFENRQGKYGIVKTPYKDVVVDIPRAYRHFYQNTHNTNRNYLKGAFFDILQKPMFIAEQETDKGLSTYFYKVYHYGKDKIGVFGIGIDKNGEIEYKTMYADIKQNRLQEMIRLDDENIKYINLEQL